MPEKEGYSPKPETDIKFTQKPAAGGYDSSVANHTKVESEAAALGVSLTPNPGHGQGGEGH